ncbi:hypothetical protein PILCRDRAFT_817783 [Piloderma croceum F 1598]|uniref:Major facilitator superfamily (MFS) profile domain-containing protein n=1 Tax=Piloderma croceum (strain F 1598) TaxID=765440 RepID=A0A0C3C5L1_PILCF|nr:hypothetical protein PILCRDRAFT_817783 [Piloderma croceum F 1598]
MASERTPLIEPVVSASDGYDSPVEQGVTKPTPLPKLQLFSVLYLQFCEPITATVIYPFIVQLVRDTGITGGDEAKTGYYAGFIESIFFAAEGLSVLQWGRVSDRIGRKPPLVFGTLGLAAAIVSFGLSKHFWPLVVSRCVQGIFNGNIGITKAVMAEIADASNIAQIFGLIPFQWGTGVTFGPMLGGILSHPADRWPGTLGKIAVFRDYPYFLPCLAAAMIPLSAFVFTSLFMKETLPSAVAHKRRKSEDQYSSSPRTEQGPASDPGDDQPPPALRDLMTRRVLVPLINYAFLAFIEQCCSVLLPLVYATSIPYGGLGLSSFTIGIIMSALGLIIGLSSAVFFPMLLRKFGIYRLYRAALGCYLINIASFPTMNLLAKHAGHVNGYVWAVLVVQIACTTMTVMSFACLFVYISDSAPTKSALGAVNGLGQTVACSARIFAPLIASSLFSVTHQHNLLGGTMVYWILWMFVIAGVYASSKLPRHLKSQGG